MRELGVATLCIAIGSAAVAAQSLDGPEPIGRIKRFDAALDEIVAPGAQVQKLCA